MAHPSTARHHYHRPTPPVNVPIDAYITPKTSYFDAYPNGPGYDHAAAASRLRLRRSRGNLGSGDTTTGRAGEVQDEQGREEYRALRSKLSQSRLRERLRYSRSTTPAEEVAAASGAWDGRAAPQHRDRLTHPAPGSASGRLPSASTSDLSQASPRPSELGDTPDSYRTADDGVLGRIVAPLTPSDSSSPRQSSRLSVPPSPSTASAPLSRPCRPPQGSSVKSRSLRSTPSCASIVPFPTSPAVPPASLPTSPANEEEEDLFAGPRTSLYFDPDTGELITHSPNVEAMDELVGTLNDWALPAEVRNMKKETREMGKKLARKEKEDRARREREREERRKAKGKGRKSEWSNEPVTEACSGGDGDVEFGLGVSLPDADCLPVLGLFPSSRFGGGPPGSLPLVATRPDPNVPSSSRYSSANPLAASTSDMWSAPAHRASGSSGPPTRLPSSRKSLASIKEHHTISTPDAAAPPPFPENRIPSIDEIVAKHAAAVRTRHSALPLNHTGSGTALRRASADASTVSRAESKPIPSIDDIIKAHKPALEASHSLVRRRPPTAESNDSSEDRSARASLDSIADEVQQSLRRLSSSPIGDLRVKPKTSLPASLATSSLGRRPSHKRTESKGSLTKGLHHAKSFPDRPASRNSSSYGSSTAHGNPPASSRSTPTPTPYSAYEPIGIVSLSPPRSIAATGGGPPRPLRRIGSAPPVGAPALSSTEQDLAQYLRSPRLTTLLKLKKPPNDHMMVSLADVGSPSGRPVVVFLGLGCVRYLVALYDEVAEALGLRLICIDRWGLGKTTDIPDSRRGFLEWSAVVEEVADQLGLGTFSVLAHSAGAPYALATSLRLDDRVHGSIHLLAPWVSTSAEGGAHAGGYKWLKYVPSSMIRTAQAAEWKMHGWLLGKPPTVTVEPVGYDMRAPTSSSGPQSPVYGGSFAPEDDEGVEDERGSVAGRGRRSSGVSEWSYLSGGGAAAHEAGTSSSYPTRNGRPSAAGPKGFFGKVLTTRRSASGSAASDSGSSPACAQPSSSAAATTTSAPLGPGGSKPGGLARTPSGRSLHLAQSGSMGKASAKRASCVSTASTANSDKPSTRDSESTRPTSPSSGGHSDRLIAPLSPPFPLAPLAATSQSHHHHHHHQHHQQHREHHPQQQQQQQQPQPKADLGTALLRASYAESLRGGTADLLAILERTERPWGFSYVDVECPVKVWHGDRDERIALASARWMGSAMPRCSVRVVEGADHSLMTNVKVMMEALESIADEWKRPAM